MNYQNLTKTLFVVLLLPRIYMLEVDIQDAINVEKIEYDININSSNELIDIDESYIPLVLIAERVNNLE